MVPCSVGGFGAAVVVPPSVGGFCTAVVVSGANVASSVGVVIVSLDSVVGNTEIRKS
jgi:hypothetical protein